MGIELPGGLEPADYDLSDVEIIEEEDGLG